MIEPVIIGNQGEADMDGGPFRGSRPTDTRRTVTRQEPVQQRQPEQPQITTEEPKNVHRKVTPHPTKKQDKSKKRFVLLCSVMWSHCSMHSFRLLCCYLRLFRLTLLHRFLSSDSTSSICWS